MTFELRPGDVVMADFPEHSPSGHEQERRRPAVVVGRPSDVGEARFNLAMFVPLSKQTPERLEWARACAALYPLLEARRGGLRLPSIALVDQARALDVRRVVEALGALPDTDMASIRDGLRRLLKL